MLDDWVDEVDTNAISHHPLDVESATARIVFLRPPMDWKVVNIVTPAPKAVPLAEFKIIADGSMLNLWRKPATSLDN
jgi:hypothetical protein